MADVLNTPPTGPDDDDALQPDDIDPELHTADHAFGAWLAHLYRAAGDARLPLELLIAEQYFPYALDAATSAAIAKRLHEKLAASSKPPRSRRRESHPIRSSSVALRATLTRGFDDLTPWLPSARMGPALAPVRGGSGHGREGAIPIGATPFELLSLKDHPLADFPFDRHFDVYAAVDIEACAADIVVDLTPHAVDAPRRWYVQIVHKVADTETALTQATPVDQYATACFADVHITSESPRDLIIVLSTDSDGFQFHAPG